MAFGTANVGTYFVDIVPNMSKFNSEMSSQASSGGSKFGSLFSSYIHTIKRYTRFNFSFCR